MKEHLFLTPKQHSKILGFALIAYSWSLLSVVVRFISDTTILDDIYKVYFQSGFITLLGVLYKEYGGIFYFFIIFISGISILLFKDKRRYFSLLFVLCYIDVFPLGTILCFYTLLYLFVISENKIESIKDLANENLSKET